MAAPRSQQSRARSWELSGRPCAAPELTADTSSGDGRLARASACPEHWPATCVSSGRGSWPLHPGQLPLHTAQQRLWRWQDFRAGVTVPETKTRAESGPRSGDSGISLLVRFSRERGPIGCVSNGKRVTVTGWLCDHGS